MSEDLKEFVEALEKRKAQTKEVIRLLTKAGSMSHIATLPDSIVQTEILANQLAILTYQSIIMRRLDDLEEWNQGRLRDSAGKSDTGAS